MKTLANKQTEISNGKDGKITYADLTRICVNNIEKGLGAEDMRKRISIIEAVEKAEEDGADILLEDEHAKTLKVCANSAKFTVIHKDIVGFMDDVNKL